MKTKYSLLFAALATSSAVFAQERSALIANALAVPDSVAEEFMSIEPASDEEMIEVQDSFSVLLFDSRTEQLYWQWQQQMSEYPPCDSDSTFTLLLTKEDYIKRLSALPNVIEMPYNQVVESYILMYARKRRNQVSYMLGLSKYYFPMFEEELEAAGMPIELKYLPVIESALNPQAFSRVGAAGLWQFMPGTGKLYGLENNSLVDERRDPVKATKAAVRYLNDLYTIYQDWLLVIAAYNCGPGNVNKAVRRANTKKDYWAIYNYLPRETRGYVPAFIAANYIMTYAADYKICPAQVPITPAVDTLMVTDRVHFSQISEKLGVPVEQLRLLNPQYKHDMVPGNIKPYPLRMPTLAAYAYLESKDSIIAYKKELVEQRLETDIKRGYNSSYYSGDARIHKVRSGENLSVIAKRYGVSVKNLRQWNGLRSDNLRVGQRLKVSRPQSGSSSQTASASTSNSTSAQKSTTTSTSTTSTTTSAQPTAKAEESGEVYKVRSGDNLWTISRRYGVTVEAIRQVNAPKKLDVLSVGQVIKLPKR